MEKHSKRHGFVTFFTILTVILLCIAFFFALVTGFGKGLPGVSGLSRVCKHLCAGIPFSWWPQITLLIMLVLLFMFLAAAGKWVDRASRKKLIVLSILLSLFLILIQLLIVFRLNIIQNTDSFEVQDQAMAIAKGMFSSVDYTKSNYFRKYGNNDLYLLTCIGIYRLCDLLSIRNWPKVFALINMLCVDLGILFTCDIVRCMTSRRTALKAYLLCVLNPLNVLLLQWTYTCTFSVPLMMAGIWIAVRLHCRRPPLPVCVAGCAAIGCITAIGYYMRPTAVFPLIALILAEIFLHAHRLGRRYGKAEAMPAEDYAESERRTAGIPDPINETRTARALNSVHEERTAIASDHANEKQVRRHSCRIYKGYQKFLLLLLAITVMAGTALSIRHLNSRYDPDSQTKFPLQHWIMIGIRGSGRVTGEDIQYTENFTTKEEKTAADQAAIKAALQERGMAGTILHYIEKVGLTWSDGTSEYYQRTTQSENSGQILYQLVNGEYCGGILLYCQAYRIILLLFAIIGILRSLRSRKEDLVFTTFIFTL
ncbi:MAG: hypothetical protein ACI4ET_08595, partial [Bilifractor sp.]